MAIYSISEQISAGLLFTTLGLLLVYVLYKRILCPPPTTIPRTVYGPKSYPIVGSLFSFWWNRRRQIEWVTEMLRQSPTQTIVVERLGGITTVFTANPSNVQHILKTRFHNYPKGEPFTAILHDLLGRGIFNADGDSWKFQRKVASYEFSSRSLRNFTLDVVRGEVADRLLPLLRTASERGSVVDMQDILQRFAFDNICKVAFGIDPAYLDTSLPVSELAQAFDLATALSAQRSADPISLVWKVKSMLNIGSEKRLSEAVGVVHEFAEDVIRRRREEMSMDGWSLSPKNDLLSRFMALTNSHYLSEQPEYMKGLCEEEFVRDIIISFMLAGRDTTSAALTWFFWLLSSHPQVEEAIRREIAQIVEARGRNGVRKASGGDDWTYEELQRMNYVHASISESMRLYPPVPLDSKHAVEDDVLADGTYVGRGTRVTYHPYAMGRMESIWGADCMDFKPSRWLSPLDGSFVPESSFKYAVFQGGMRVCLGREMALVQMKYVAASLIHSFSLRPLGSSFHPKFIHCLTARMEGGLHVGVQRRPTAIV
eukprot:Gb_16936 [translate_table: standard]